MLASHKRALFLGLAFALVAGCGDEEPMVMEPTTIDAPTGLTGQAVDERSIDLTWTAVTGATSYRVERQPVGGTFSQVGDVATASFTDTGLNPATVYTYRVIAVASDGATSNASETVTITTAGVEVIGNISAATTWTADNIYLLKGVVQVQDGAVLTIEAGTTVLGDKATAGTLIVLQGGQIIADGTAANPIVFTSGAAPGNRAKGDWGGVVINGNSNCNFPAGECLGEGNTGPYGGSDPDDNSGILRYVRIEWAGIEFSPGNELNGLTLNGVGSGTTIEFVQAHGGLDDGIELFGGTVDIKHALVTRASDDSFDWSTGWIGRGQFWIVQQDPDDADNGFEVDNNEGDFDALPRTFGEIYNFTLIGKPAGVGQDGESTRGMLFRRGYSGSHSCGIVMGFGRAGLDIDDAATATQVNQGNLTLTNVHFFDNGREQDGFASPGVNYDPDGGDADGDNTGADDFEATFAAGQTGIVEEDPMLADPYNLADPDFSPMAGSPVIAGNCTPPNDGFFDNVAYRGAVADGADDWYKGWTTSAAN